MCWLTQGDAGVDRHEVVEGDAGVDGRKVMQGGAGVNRCRVTEGIGGQGEMCVLGHSGELLSWGWVMCRV